MILFSPGLDCSTLVWKHYETGTLNYLCSVIDFDQQVQESKYKAEDALHFVPEIRQLIADAENKTGDARQALAGAEHNAQIARDTAQEAQQKYAEQASHVRPQKIF
jgi:coxsackievirus/adenovirus receptor